MIGKLLCGIGWHRWVTLVCDGVNFFAPMHPRRHLEQCSRCRICRTWGHTMYGSVAHYWDDLPQAETAIGIVAPPQLPQDGPPSLDMGIQKVPG
jgi:hypothetical protein